jgi:hypothetical protein
MEMLACAQLNYSLKVYDGDFEEITTKKENFTSGSGETYSAAR